MLRELWKSVSVESGAQSVMKAGIVMMLQWCASSWDSREQVNCNVTTTGNRCCSSSCTYFTCSLL